MASSQRCYSLSLIVNEVGDSLECFFNQQMLVSLYAHIQSTAFLLFACGTPYGKKNSSLRSSHTRGVVQSPVVRQARSPVAVGLGYRLRFPEAVPPPVVLVWLRTGDPTSPFRYPRLILHSEQSKPNLFPHFTIVTRYARPRDLATENPSKTQGIYPQYEISKWATRHLPRQSTRPHKTRSTSWPSTNVV